MARIPAFFRSTFPVETYGAMFDPNQMSIAARAEKQSALSELSNVGDLINAYFAGNSPSFSYGSGGRGGVDKSTERSGILDRAEIADYNDTVRGKLSEQEDAYNEAKQTEIAARKAEQPTEPKPSSKAKVYKVEDSTISKLNKLGLGLDKRT